MHLIVTFRHTFPGGGGVNIGFRVLGHGNSRNDFDRLTALGVEIARSWHENPASFDGLAICHRAIFSIVSQQTLDTMDLFTFTEPDPLERIGWVGTNGHHPMISAKLEYLLTKPTAEQAA